MRVRWLFGGMGAAVIVATTLLVTSLVGAQAPVVVSLAGAPAYVQPEATFTIQVNVGEMTDFDAAQYYMAFDPAVLTIDAVADGVIGGTSIRNYAGTGPGGPRTVLINATGIAGISGSGFISEINFRATGDNGNSSTIELTGLLLVGIDGTQAVEIASTFAGSVTVSIGSGGGPTLVLIAVTPETPSIPVGATQAFTATGTYSEGDPADITDQAVWTSEYPAVATIDAATGVATGVAAGTTTITATLGVSGSASLEVTAEVTLVSIVVAPASASILVDATQAFTATGAYSDDTTPDVTAAWESSNIAVATIDAATGVATGVTAGETTITATFNGKTDTAILTVTEPEPSPGGSPGSSYTTTTTVTPPEIETDLFGTEESFETDSDGEIQETVEATSEDGALTLTIPEGTIARDENGDPLETLEAALDESPASPPEDAAVIGLAYDFGPDGATFDPPITITFSYDPDALPDGVAEEDLVIAYYDEAAGEWVELDSVVDAENNIVTAYVVHFTTFALIGTAPPPEEEVAPPPDEEEPPPTPEPAVDEEEEVAPPPDEEVEIAPDEEVEVAPPDEEVEVAPEEEIEVADEVATVVEEEEPAGIKWSVVGPVIGVVVVALLFLFFSLRTRLPTGPPRR